MKNILTLFAIAASIAVQAQTYYPIPVNGKVAYIDSVGNWVIQPNFSRGKVYTEGLAAVSTSNDSGEHSRWYFVNKDLSIVVKFGFYEATEFHEGLAAVKSRRGWNYVDKENKIAIKGDYDSAGHFNEGLARIRLNGYWALIDKEARYVLNPNYAEMGNYSGRMVAVKHIRSSHWIYTTFAGDSAIRDTFEYAGDMNHGLAPVKKGGWYYINTKGKKILAEDSWVEVRPFYGKLASVQKNDGRWYLINTKGEELRGLSFTKPVDFHHGLAWAESYEEGNGYLNQEGKWVYRESRR